MAYAVDLDDLGPFDMILAEEEAMLQDAEDDEYALITVMMAIAISGIEQARQQRNERQNAHRTYLSCPQLLQNPCMNTPWTALYNSRSDRAFITTMGLNVETFKLILSGGFSDGWDSLHIPRNETPQNSMPRPHCRSLDAAGALGLALHHLCSTMQSSSLQQIFAIIPATCSRYLRFSLHLLLATLRSLDTAKITWPSPDMFSELSELVQARHPLLLGAFAIIDGLKVPVKTSDNIEWENATYNGWLHAHFVLCVLAFAANGMLFKLTCTQHNMSNKWCFIIVRLIIGGRHNCPGSWHDARVARPIYDKLQKDTPDGYYIVADTAFPRGTDQIAGKIHAPMKEGERLPSDDVELGKALRFNQQLLSYQQTAEWGMRALQCSFGRLRMPLDINDNIGRANLLEICFRLHNIRTRLVGVNQIQSVYVPIWRDGDQDELWDGFEGMDFLEQQRRDRVSRFHIMPSFD